MSSSESVAYAFEQLDGSMRVTPGAGGELEAERIREAARATAETEGRAAGLAHAHELARPALAALSEALADVELLREEITEQLEREAVELALALAEQIVHAAIEVAPERVIDAVRGALRRLSDRLHVTAVVNPDDLELVSRFIDPLRAELGGIEHLAVQSDRRIGRGGAVVRTREGEIDAQVQTQLARVRAIVAAELTRG